ncbi:hypothetical protein BGZ58_008465 [Dissophora ornata]|nr:hypothetical protein BGZ58_008465 [Dissophora ornata]
MMSLDTAIDALTKDLENGGYFHQVSPKDFGAEGFFKGFDDQRRARAVWTTSVIPRLISSKHPTSQRAGLGLQGKWNSQAYRKQLSRALEQEVIVLDSVRKHQTEILNHSYEDLCHTLKRRKASFRESEDTTGQYDPTEISHAATGTLDKSSSTTGEQTGDDPSSSNSVSDTDRCNSPVAGTSDVGGPVCEVEEDSDEVDQDIGDKDDLSLTRTVKHWQRNISNSKIRSFFRAERFSKTFYLPTESSKGDINVDDMAMKDMFTPEDWFFITKEQELSINLRDQDIVDVLEHFKQADSLGTIMALLQERHPRLGKGFIMEQDYDVKWIFDSISRWLDLYTMPFSVFTSDAHLNTFGGVKSGVFWILMLVQIGQMCRKSESSPRSGGNFDSMIFTESRSSLETSFFL